MVDGAVGLAIGRFTELPAEDHPMDDVLREFAERLAVPTVVDLPVGHVEHNWTLPIGARVALDGDAGSLTLTEAAVSG
jgi:muramoyltetrapeptide carboxypeptidase